jgi:hypothetical protein
MGIGIVSVLLYHSVTSRPVTGSVASDLALGTAAAAAVSAAGSLLIGDWTALKRILLPRLWTGVTAVGPPDAKDLVARWFVTIAASTGSIVGSLAGQGDFWHAAIRALAPTHILFTLLLVVVSITLIGPLEEYIFGQRLARGDIRGAQEVDHGGARSLLQDIWRNLSPRATGRLGLVFLLSLQPTLLHECVGEVVMKGDALATLSVLNAAIFPAFVTYYWSAALQQRERSVARQAGLSSTCFGALVWWAAPVVNGLSWLQPSRTDEGALFIAFAFAVAVVFYVVFGVLVDGTLAYAGGWALDRARRSEVEPWQAVAMLGGVLLVTYEMVNAINTIVVSFFSFGYDWRFGFDWRQLLYAAPTIIGWTGGLLVSGFPTILYGARVHAARVRA